MKYPDLGFEVAQNKLNAIAFCGSSFQVISASCFVVFGTVKSRIAQSAKQALLVI
jgi:hypothetical protein